MKKKENRMKKTISIALFLIMAFVLLTGCGTATPLATAKPAPVNAAPTAVAATAVPPAATAAPAAAKKLIGFSMANTDEYRTSWLKAFTALLGDQYDLKTTNADKDFNKQIGDIDSLLALNPSLLIIQPASDDAIVPALEIGRASCRERV
jgi:ABC-type sugar transport system, periplasmic component